MLNFAQNSTMRSGFFFVLAIFGWVSCQTGSPPQEVVNVPDLESIYTRGASIAQSSQAALLEQVSRAITAGGPDFAVAFCHEKAGPVIDSLARANDCRIHRISDRYRNPSNQPANEAEFALMMDYFNRKIVGDTVLLSDNHPVFYRPIVLGLETCLKCHGQPGTDIAASTLEKIQERYPTDQATGYRMHDVRGLWKISFPVRAED